MNKCQSLLWPDEKKKFWRVFSSNVSINASAIEMIKIIKELFLNLWEEKGSGIINSRLICAVDGD